MAEYIEREALVADIDNAVDNAGMGRVIGQTLKRYIKRQPTGDVVEVVRCKDCRHSRVFRKTDRWVDCPYYDESVVSFDHFCSYGERKGGE
jgi:ribosomal protein S27E